MLSLGSMCGVELQTNNVGNELKDIRVVLNGITAHLMIGKREGSMLTAYSGDDSAVWKDSRRRLISEGFPSSLLHRHKATIESCIEELGSRGLLDEVSTIDDEERPSNLGMQPEEGRHPDEKSQLHEGRQSG